MQCYRVRVKEAPPLVGFSADGRRRAVFPGEYAVHLMRRPTARGVGAALRFVGADPRGGDLHVPQDALRDWPRLPPGAPLEIIDPDA